MEYVFGLRGNDFLRLLFQVPVLFEIGQNLGSGNYGCFSRRESWPHSDLHLGI